jgi:hypothetical protein
VSEIKNQYEEAFKNHKATLIQDSDRYTIIDWRREDGSGDYYANYIVDKLRGSLIVSGDIGDSIATWYNPLTPAKIKGFIHNNVDYYIGKIQCASNIYTYYSDDVVSDIKSYLDKDCIDEYLKSSDEFSSEQELWEFIEAEVINSTSNSFIPSESLSRVIEQIMSDSYEWLYCCGRRIHPRVYLWSTGFYMACNQLGI